MRTAASVSRGGGYNVRPVLAIFAFGALLLMMTGCNTTCSTPDCAPLAVPVVADGPPTTGKVEDPDDVKYYRSDEPLRMGIEHFNRGNYGIAERYFRDAVEKAPKDVTALVGLAASYDRLARFDLADRAYRMAIRLAGETTEILNNQGYSYMLRGDLGAARRKFEQALQREPYNPTILNNLQLLNGSSRMIQRNPG